MKPTTKATEKFIFKLKTTNTITKIFQDKIGLDPNECDHVIEVSAINHVFKNHGNPSYEESRGLTVVNISDYELIPEIIKKPDTITINTESKPLPIIVYSKKIGDEYFYVEEVRKGKKVLALKTMYIKKKPK